MPVILRRSKDLPDPVKYDCWCSVTGTDVQELPRPRLPRLTRRLERAFESEREHWWTVGRDLGQDPTAEYAHMPTAGSYGSDFGLMLAWRRLVREAATDGTRCLVLCDDPWLFRELASLAGVEAGVAPSLLIRSFLFRLRGVIARASVALRVAAAVLLLGRQRAIFREGDPAILVYGHPVSNATGYDAYFGDLMRTIPALRRVLHTDCGISQARRIGADGRSASLHAWGSIWFAPRLAFVRWKPSSRSLGGPFAWLIRRAVESENRGGGPAMNAWQQHCQRRWITTVRPRAIAWPWENHGWERALCRVARTLGGVATIGYQHTAIGPHQFNYAIATNLDGLDSIPDTIVANGPPYRDEMQALGVPSARLVVGGAFRFSFDRMPVFDRSAPIFVALSANRSASRHLIEAALNVAACGRKVLVKNHPMYPVKVPNHPDIVETAIPLLTQPCISAVLYSTGTSGLEAILAGLPTFRLLLDDRIAVNVLPPGLVAVDVTMSDVGDVICRSISQQPKAIDPTTVFTKPDIELWSRLMAPRAA